MDGHWPIGCLLAVAHGWLLYAVIRRPAVSGTRRGLLWYSDRRCADQSDRGSIESRSGPFTSERAAEGGSYQEGALKLQALERGAGIGQPLHLFFFRPFLGVPAVRVFTGQCAIKSRMAAAVVFVLRAISSNCGSV